MLVVLLVVAATLLAFGAIYWTFRRRRLRVADAVPSGKRQPEAVSEPESGNSVTYAPPEFEWSGNSSGILPLKIITYKQYECLEDARYGFRIVALKPTELDAPQPHKTRGHGLKTVASLSKHGFLSILPDSGYVITDHGLNALATCTVRY